MIETGGAAPIRYLVAQWRLLVLGVAGRSEVLWIMLASRGSALRKSGVMALAILTRQPYVVHVHGGGFAAYLEGLPGPVRAAQLALLRRARRVVALSDTHARKLSATTGMQVVDVLPNAVPGPRHLTAASPNAGSPSTRFVFVGAATHAKGAFDLFRALPAGSSLSMIGPFDHEAERASREARGPVEFLGWRSDVAAHLPSHDVLVLPSYIETMPMVVLEAMAHGLPVVATDVGSLSDVVTAETGLLVSPGDIEALHAALVTMTDPSLRRRMARAAHARWQERYDAAGYGARVVTLALAPG